MINSNLMARKRTRWKPLSPNRVKLNFDGAARKEGLVSGGRVKDSKGSMLVAYNSPLGKDLNNVTEVMALWGLKLVITMGWRDVKIEKDSKIIIETIKGNMRKGWAIK